MSATVWIVVQLREGRPDRISWETLAAAQRLAGELGGHAVALVLGSGVEAAAREVAAKDLAAVRVVDDPALTRYTPEAVIAALAPLIANERPAFVLFPHTYQSVDFVPRLAQRLSAGLLPEITAFRSTDDGLVWRRPILGGKLQAEVRAKGEGTVLVSVQSGAFAADEAAVGEAPIEPAAVDLAGFVPDREILGVEEVAGEQVDLSQAPVIVAVGRGVGGGDKLGPVEELARALGAEIGASRPVIDNGWLPRDRQIGSSGQTVAPKLYVAVGISGAIQHLVGMKGSQVVVAINKDASAPIFTVARYGIVGDLHEVLPALTSAIVEARQG